jgi:hypothetical protein
VRLVAGCLLIVSVATVEHSCQTLWSVGRNNFFVVVTVVVVSVAVRTTVVGVVVTSERLLMRR